MGKVIKLATAPDAASSGDAWVSVPGFGQLWRRGRTWWIKYSVDGQVYRESSKSTEQRNAEKLLRARIKQSGRGGRFVDPNKERRVTIDTLLDAYHEWHKGKRNRSRVNNRIEHLKRHLGHERAVMVDEARIEKYKADRRTEPSPKGGLTAEATINRELAALRKAFKLAVKRKQIAAAPEVQLFPEDNARQGFVEHETFEKIATALDQPWQDAARFAYLTGWRLREVYDLGWSEVDWQHKLITLPGARAKNKEARPLPITGDLVPVMARRREAQDGALVFHHDGQRIVDIRKRWRKACAAAGVPGLLFHDLRRSAVMNFERNRVPRSVAMRVTGHKTESVYRRYAIPSVEDLGNALDAVSNGNG
jgi:integrase